MSRFSDEYGKVSGIPRVSESAARDYRHGVPEQVLRCIWYDRLFRADEVSTFDGRPIEVLSPGRWNFEEGPDFVLSAGELLILPNPEDLGLEVVRVKEPQLSFVFKQFAVGPDHGPIVTAPEDGVNEP